MKSQIFWNMELQNPKVDFLMSESHLLSRDCNHKTEVPCLETMFDDKGPKIDFDNSTFHITFILWINGRLLSSGTSS